MSRHQSPALTNVVMNPKINNEKPMLNPCAYNVNPNNIKQAPNATTSGHGLGSTIW